MIDADPLYAHLRTAMAAGGGTPLYRRLAQAVRAAVGQGLIGVEEALPSERDLAQILGLSRVTVRNAVRALVAEGLLVQRHGAGTFVAGRVEQPLSRLTGFTEDMRARGWEPDVRWLARMLGRAVPEEALALGLSPGATVARLHRIRLADGKPMCLEQASLPADVLPDPGAVTQSLYALLDARGLRPVRALQRLRAELFDPEPARLLAVPAGSACLYIERRSYLADGRPVEFVRSYYRGDAYDFVAELQI